MESPGRLGKLTSSSPNLRRALSFLAQCGSSCEPLLLMEVGVNLSVVIGVFTQVVNL